MSVNEIRLSPRVEAGFSATPARMTRVRQLKNGHERRNGDWAMAKHRYSCRHAGFDRDARAELLNAVHASSGQLYGFRFKDWNDYSVTEQPIGPTPAGSAPVQLVKTYTWGSRTATRVISRPVGGTVTVFQNGVPKDGTLDIATGIFTPSTAWSAGEALTWTGEFDVPVRFATDEIEFVLLRQIGRWAQPDHWSRRGRRPHRSIMRPAPCSPPPRSAAPATT